MKKLLSILLFLVINVCLFTISEATDYSFGGDTASYNLTAQKTDSAIWLDTATTPAYAGTLDSGLVWLSANYNTHSAAIIIYEVAGADTSIIDSTAHWTLTAGDGTVRYAKAFINKAAVGASTKYLIGVHFACAGGVDGDGTIKLIINDAVHVTSYSKQAQAVVPAALTSMTATANLHMKTTRLFYHDEAAPGSTISRRRAVGGQ